MARASPATSVTTHERLQRFDSEDFDECQFLHLLINVLHLLISLHDIGLNYASIVRQGMT